MPTREIESADWAVFFHGFTNAHQGWFVTMEVLGDDIGAQVEAGNLLFQGASADLKHGRNRIDLIVVKLPIPISLTQSTSRGTFGSNRRRTASRKHFR